MDAARNFREHRMAAKCEPLPPLFKADSATLAFYATKDGNIDRHGFGD